MNLVECTIFLAFYQQKSMWCTVQFIRITTVSERKGPVNHVDIELSARDSNRRGLGANLPTMQVACGG